MPLTHDQIDMLKQLYRNANEPDLAAARARAADLFTPEELSEYERHHHVTQGFIDRMDDVGLVPVHDPGEKRDPPRDPNKPRPRNPLAEAMFPDDELPCD